MRRTPILLDSDPGLDDAVALHYLLTRQECELKAYTAVGGNLPVECTFRNARALASAFGIDDDVPVFQGAGRPISRVKVRSSFHGPTGLGQMVLSDSKAPTPSEDAVSAMLRLSRQFEGELTVAATGPLTNIAAALVLDPAFAGRIRHLVFMGGAAMVPGNMTSVAEFNIWADPDAADIVLSSGITYTMVGLDATHQAIFTSADLAHLEKGPGAMTGLSAQLMRDYLRAYSRFTGSDHCFLHDPLTVGVAVDERFVSTEPGVVAVSCDLGLTRGQTVFLSEVAAQGDDLPEVLRARLDCSGSVAMSQGQLDFTTDFVQRLRAPLPSPLRALAEDCADFG
ncbi:nucleoside hydrolase [Streptomyces sp. NPDC050164]|uniref:nucleoside hydrolase n=1 Tax=Streptomyces sp. NPDC050164 TaxID=3365605 RepID=UPI003787F9FF